MDHNSCYLYLGDKQYMNFIDTFLDDAEQNSSKRILRNINPISSRECEINGEKYINFSSNDYLGLSQHSALIAESIQWTKQFGSGSAASRLVTGTTAEVAELETKIAKWKNKEAALIFGSGYMTNSGVIPAISDKSTAIFADKLNHASLNAGCQLSSGKLYRYKHNDMTALENLLIKHQDVERKIIISDTIFSMDGDIAKIADFANLAKKYDALLYLDDAHGTGVFGEFGEGLTQNCDIAMGTFSKAMGGYGAYIACSAKMKEYLINKCGSFIYTTAMSPANYGAISAAVDLVQSTEYCGIRKKYQNSFQYLKNEIKEMGYDVGETNSGIIPIILKSSEKVLEFSKKLLDAGLLCVAIRPPTVPQNSARIRITLNATHTEKDIKKLLTTLKLLKDL